MENFKISDKVIKKVSEYNNAIDEFVTLLLSLKVEDPEVLDLQEKRKKLHEAFFKSNNAKLEKLIQNLYDDYTEELADFVNQLKR